MPDTLRLAVYLDSTTAVRAAADSLHGLAHRAGRPRGQLHTPQALYELLASEDYRDRTDWHEV